MRSSVEEKAFSAFPRTHQFFRGHVETPFALPQNDTAQRRPLRRAETLPEDWVGAVRCSGWILLMPPLVTGRSLSPSKTGSRLTPVPTWKFQPVLVAPA